MKRPVTIVEVANRAAVALSTVSRVLNGGYASPEVKARVEKASLELGFVPSTVARNLKKGRQGCIGLVTESSQGNWFLQLLGGIEEELQQSRVSMLLGSLQLSSTYDANAVLGWLTERRVDGLLICGCTERERPIVNLAKKRKVELVFVAPDTGFEGGPAFRARNADGGIKVAEHLSALGHRSVAFVGGPPESVDTQQRLRGLRAGLAERHIEMREEDIVFAGTYEYDGGVAYAKIWLAALQGGTASTAVVLANDALALGFMRTVLCRGVRVPADVSVVGFDGSREGALYWPGLTSGEQPTREMGKIACQTLLAAIEGKGTEGSGAELPITLRVRESTGPALRALGTAIAAVPSVPSTRPPAGSTEAAGDVAASERLEKTRGEPYRKSRKNGRHVHNA